MSQETRSTGESGDTSSIVAAVRHIDGEQLLFWLVMIVAAYMFVAAGAFVPEAALFPRLTAGVVVVGGVLQIFVARSERVRHYSQIVSPDSGDSLTSTNKVNADTEDAERLTATEIRRMLSLAVLIVGYVVGGYLVGLLWVTPLFVAGYLLIADQSYLRTLLLTVAVTGVAYGFYTIMNIDIITGVL